MATKPKFGKLTKIATGPIETEWPFRQGNEMKNASVLLSFLFAGFFTAWSHAAHSKDLLFNSSDRIYLTLTAPLKELIEKGKAEHQDKGKDSTFSVPGTLAVPASSGSISLNVELSLRGQTSVALMDFPKYKIKFTDKKNAELGPFENIKVVSHGWEKDSDQIIGAGGGILQSRLGAFREASVYDLLREADLPLSQTRRAVITYVSTDQKKTITEPALLIESYKSVGKRLGGTEISPLVITQQEVKQLAQSSWTAIVYLAEVLIANWDFAIPTPLNPETGLHNITVIKATGETLIPFMEDFNMASMVSTNSRLDPHIKEDFFPQKNDIFRSKVWAFRSIHDEFNSATVKKAVQYFLDREQRLMNKVGNLDVDEKGRENIKNHLKAFFEILHQPQYWTEPAM